MSVMLPRMLEVCVQATSFVFGDNRGFREEGVRRGLLGEEEEGDHQIILQDRQVAMASQDATFASWSRVERMISEPGVRWS